MERNDPRRRRTAWRIAVGTAAAVIGIVAIVSIFDGPAAVDGAPKVGQVTTQLAGVYTAAGVQITDGSDVSAAGFSPIAVREPGTNVTQVKCVLDGAFLGSDTSAPYAFDVTSPAAGDLRLRCSLRDDTGSNDFRVNFTVGAPAPTTTAGSMSPTSPTSPADPTTTTGPANPGDVVVTDAASLQRALAQARPGTTITLADGTYSGKEVKDPSGHEPGRFVAAVSGTAAAPIVLRGSRRAILDGGGTGGGYALHLSGANYWKLQGFTVQSASKGIVLDGSNNTMIDGVHVTNIGAEGIHYRAFSSDNLLTNSTVDNTGINAPNFGEGVYIGSAQSNWGTYTNGEPDNSDRNQIIDNTIIDTAAENVDIKEGSSGGVIRGNYLGGDRIASKNSADSWIDVKGNGYLIDSNHGVTAPRPSTTECGDPKTDPDSTKNPFCEGMQVHVILDGWGQHNTFSNNKLEVNSPGAGIWLQNTAVPLGNVISCNNQVTGAGAGAYATNHYSALACQP